MKDNYHKDIARYRLERAIESLSSARQNYHLGNYKITVSQSYYCILSAMRALLALQHVDSHRQEGVITLFHKHYVRANLFPKDFNKVIKKTKEHREEADYGDFAQITKEMAESEIASAERFLRIAEEVFAKILAGKGTSPPQKVKNTNKLT